MFFKNMRVAYLLDFYGDLLDEHTAGIMRAYYNDDLSLSEIADGVGISRQGIRHLIKKGEEQLEFFEGRLHLSERHVELSEAAVKLTEALEEIADEENCRDAAEKIREVIAVILKGNQDVPESY